MKQQQGQGEGGTASPLVILHGLFGGKQNWRAIGKALSTRLNRQVYALDLRNHGESEHAEEHTYPIMAQDVVEFMGQQGMERAVLMGHSMGAKVAMVLALEHNAMVEKLISVDNSPVRMRVSEEFTRYVKGMQDIERAKVRNRGEADRILERIEGDLSVRQFLLTNLLRHENGTMEFRVPVTRLGDALPALSSFPFRPGEAVYKGPALIVKGTRSRYVQDKYREDIKAFFPNYKIIEVEAGHWVQAENPQAFLEGVIGFLESNK